MSTINNVVITNGVLISWEEFDEVFTVTYSNGKPTVISSKSGKYGDQYCEFSYHSNGSFKGMSQEINTTYLPYLIALANGVVTATETLAGGLELSAGANRVTPLLGVRLENRSAIRRLLSRQPTAAGAGFTVTQQVQAAAPFVGFTLRYENLSTSDFTVSAVIAGPVPADLDTGVAAALVPVTFGGAATKLIPAGSGASSNRIGQIVDSDVTFCQPAGADNLIQVRSYCVGAASWQNGTGTWMANQRAAGQMIAGKVDGADVVTGKPAVVVAASGTWWGPAVRFIYSVPSVTVAVVGDSVDSGYLGTDDMFGPAYYACKAKNSTSKVYECEQRGISGQNHSTSYAQGIILLASAYKPDILCFKAWSPNDGLTQANFDKSWAETMDLIDRCIRAGVIPMVLTTGPQNSLSAPQKAILNANNAKVRALAGQIIVADADAVLNDGAGNIKAEYDSGDHVHYNNAGYSAIGLQAILPVLP